MTQPATPLIPMVTPEGESVVVDSRDVAAARGQGLSFAEPVVHLKTASADIKPYSAEEAEKILSSSRGGWTHAATPQQFAAQEERKDYESPVGLAKTFGAGAARSLTLGLSDHAIAGFDGGKDFLEKAPAYNPGTNLAGELSGMVAPLVLSGGASAPAQAAEGAGMIARAGRAIGAVPRGIAALGEGAGELAGGALARAGVAEGGLTARAITAATQAGVENALYGVQSAVSDAAIHDDATIEKFMAAAGHGALVGAAAGGGLSLAGSLLRKGASAGAGLSAKASELAETLGLNLPTLDAFAQRKAIQATGANLRQVEELAEMAKRSPGLEERVAQMIHDEIPAAAGAKSLATVSHAKMEPAGAKLATEWGTEVRKSLQTLDSDIAKTGSKLAPDVDGVVTTIRRDVIAKVDALPGREGLAKQIAKYTDALEEKAPGSGFERFWEMRKDLDAKVYGKGRKGDATVTEAWRDVRRIVEGEILTAGDRAAREMGTEFAASYAAAKANYAAAAWVRDATAKGAKSEGKNRSVGLSEQFGLLAGGALGLAQGDDSSSAIPYAIGGAIAQNVGRRYGAQIAATLAKRAADSGIVQRLAAKTDSAMSASIGGFFGKAAPALAAEADRAYARSEKKEPLEKRFAEANASVQRVIDASPQHLAQGVAGVAEFHPDVAAKVVDKLKAGAAFLASKRPDTGTGSSLTPQLDKPEPSASEMAQYLRYVRGVRDPNGVLRDLSDLDVSPEGVEALRVVYPHLYQQARTEVLQHLMEAKVKPDYAKRAQLGILFDMATDPSLEPDAIRALQSVYAPLPSSAQREMKSGEKISISKTFQTRAGRLEGDDSL